MEGIYNKIQDLKTSNWLCIVCFLNKHIHTRGRSENSQNKIALNDISQDGRYSQTAHRTERSVIRIK